MKRVCVLLAGFILFSSSSYTLLAFQAPSKKTSGSSSLIGTWEAMEEGDVVRLIFKSESILVFEEEESTYELLRGTIRVKNAFGETTDYPYTLKGNSLVLTLPEGETMEFRRAQASAVATRPSADAGTGGENLNHLLVGKFMSYSSASSSGGSSSWTTYATFDGRGTFSWNSESAHSVQQYDQTGANTGWGVAGGANKGNQGSYRVVGNKILVRFPDGSEGEGVITERFQDGSIGAFKYDGKTYAR